MVVRVEVSGELLAWARERSRIDDERLLKKFPRLDEWQAGSLYPTLKQLESFAETTHTPVGFLFLETPPDEEIPIPDFRTMGDAGITRPSANLLETIYLCQQRQEWYREFALANGEDAVEVVGSVSTLTPIADAVAAMRTSLNFDMQNRGSSWSEAFRILSERSEDIGVLVMVSGVVGSNTYRTLDPAEFRGFALVDEYAPVVFVNAADTKAAQIFSLAHELAHVWLGQSALSDVDMADDRAAAQAAPSLDAERWCNQVAGEFLAPLQIIRQSFDPENDLTDELNRLARQFKVSTLVVLRRLHDAGFLNRPAYRAAYQAELQRVLGLMEGSTGGNFYNTQPVRVSKKFAKAIITSTLEGQTPYRDAFQMLGFKKMGTFNELGRHLGIV